MTNLEKYNEAFKSILKVSDEELNENLVYQGVSQWDSIGHMSLIIELEYKFDIMFDTDDIIDFSSYKKGIEILQSRYEIDMNN